MDSYIALRVPEELVSSDKISHCVVGCRTRTNTWIGGSPEKAVWSGGVRNLKSLGPLLFRRSKAPTDLYAFCQIPVWCVPYLQRQKASVIASPLLTCLLKAKFHYAILVADRSEAGRRPAVSWNLAYHLAR